MPRIFISHSSKNVRESDMIKTWLDENGFALSFLDYDSQSGIPVGKDWERVLYDEIECSQAVILVLTSDWQASKWCFSEYTQARALGKAIFPLLFEQCADKQISGSIQHLNLTSNSPEAYKQLLRELNTLALNTQEGFEWDKNRSPYPGMLSFDEEDAAIFFGRDDDTLRIIERLNARRTQGGSRLLALLGASGSGKSSLLKAGVLPRLRRDQRHWIVLPSFRPKLRPVRELAIALAACLDQIEKVNHFYEQLRGENVAVFLTELADQIQQKVKQFEATILVSVDQSEELFSTADPKETEQFFTIITHLKYKESPWLGIFTLRSDFLGYLQNTDSLKTDFTEISLKPMPLSRIDQIIRGPAKVAGLSVDPELIAVATEDAKTQDALPLLAFALRQLYEHYGRDGNLTLDEYKSSGDEKTGLNPLENAVRKAADDALQQSKPDANTLQALRESFIPAMVRVNDKGEYVRRPANWDELSERAYPLLNQLADARLLTIKRYAESKIVEVSHEALLRKWPLLQTWLQEEHEFLLGKDQLERSLHDWQTSDQKYKKQTLLQGLQLHRSQAWLLHHPEQLSQAEREYIQTSSRYKEQQRKRTRNLLLGFISILVVIAGFALIQWQNAVAEKQKAQIQTIEKEKRLSEVYWSYAKISYDQDKHLIAQLYAAEAAHLFPDRGYWPGYLNLGHPIHQYLLQNINANEEVLNDITFIQNRDSEKIDESIVVHKREGWNRYDPTRYEVSLSNLKPGNKEKEHIRLESQPVILARGGKFYPVVAIVTKQEPNKVSFWHPKNANMIWMDIYHPAAIERIRFSEDSRHLAITGTDGSEYLWVAASVKKSRGFDRPSYTDGIFSPTEQEIFLWGLDDNSLVDLTTNAEATKITVLPTEIRAHNARFSPNAKLIALWNYKTLEIWDKQTPSKRLTYSMENHSASVVFAPNNSYLVLATERKIKLLPLADGAVGKENFNVTLDSDITSISITPDSSKIVTAEKNGMVNIWNIYDTQGSPKKLVHKGEVLQTLFVNDGYYLLCIGEDTRLWEIKGHERPVSVLKLGSWDAASVTEDGGRLLIWKDNEAKVLSLPSGKILAKDLTHLPPIMGGHPVAGGKLFRTWDVDGNIKTWWTFSGSPLGKLKKSGVVRPKKAVSSPSGDALLFFDYDEGHRTTYQPLAGGDEDFPENHARLQVQALTGTRIDVEIGNIISIPVDEIYTLRKQYFETLEQHAKNCALPSHNLYHYLSDKWEGKAP